MFNKPTVFVVGAGASAEYSLPTGADLKQKIADGVRFRFDYSQLIKGDSVLLDALKRHFRDEQKRVNDYTHAGNELAETIATFPSIDEALYWWRAKPEIIELGKMAIAHYILEAERKSALSISRATGNVEIKDADGTWLETFLSIAVAARDREGVASAFENVTIINFNYDRTIEQYLYWALQQRVGVASEVAGKAVAGLKMIRPYGSIGKLDWTGQHDVPYGGGLNRDVFAISKNIRTFTEQTEQVVVSEDIGDALEAAHAIVFLGFGYHQQNLKMFELGTRKKRLKDKTVMASVFGIDEKNYPVIKDRLSNLLVLKSSPLLVHLKANQLLTDLRLSLTMAVA